MIFIRIFWENFVLTSELQIIESELDLPSLGIYDKKLSGRYTYDAQELAVIVSSLRSVPSAQIDALVMQSLADCGYRASLLSVDIPQRRSKGPKISEKQMRLL